MRFIHFSAVTALTIFLILFFPAQARAAGGVIIIDEEEDVIGTPAEWEEQILELIEKLAECEDDEEEALFIDDPDSEEARTIVSKLKNQKVTINFQDTPFTEVLQFLRDVTRINMVVSNDAADSIEASNRNITLRLADVRLETLLGLILQSYDEVGYAIKEGVLYFDLKEKLKSKRMYLAFYEISELVSKPPNFPGPEMALRDEGGTQPQQR